MATRSPSEIYATLREAGFSAPSAVLMTAIALAESGGNDTARGDLSLQNATWGPSYGLFQVRTVKDQTGTGQTRDINLLASSDTAQAEAAYAISRGGTDFSAWSTYTHGTYQQFLATAQAAAGGNVTANASGVVPSALGLPSMTDVRSLVVEAVFVVLGLGVVGVGIVRSSSPALKPIAHVLTRGKA